MLRLLLVWISIVHASAQIAGLSLPPSGGNQRASVSQGIGPVTVTIDYSSPTVHGPAAPGSGNIVDRRGKIWGGLVPFGMADLGFGTQKQAPWRAGANENTVFSVSHDVQINGQALAAGRYGLHMIPGPEEWTLIFSRRANEWGSFFYDPKFDALRVKAKPRKHAYREWLTYEFPVRKAAEAVVELQWEELAVGWTISVPRINEIYLSQIRQQLHNAPGFGYQAWVNASQWCVQENINLEEALEWAEYAIHGTFTGQENFQTLSNKAQVLDKLGREAEASTLMTAAIGHATATPGQVHQYGRQLLSRKKNREALAVFAANAQRFGEVWPTHVGMARGYAAVGETAKALEHARKALAQAPDAVNRAGMEALIQSLTK
jgi:tetratricopeptide (TPR) repeat protein